MRLAQTKGMLPDDGGGDDDDGDDDNGDGDDDDDGDDRNSPVCSEWGQPLPRNGLTEA